MEENTRHWAEKKRQKGREFGMLIEDKVIFIEHSVMEPEIYAIMTHFSKPLTYSQVEKYNCLVTGKMKETKINKIWGSYFLLLSVRTKKNKRFYFIYQLNGCIRHRRVFSFSSLVSGFFYIFSAIKQEKQKGKKMVKNLGKLQSLGCQRHLV